MMPALKTLTAGACAALAATAAFAVPAHAATPRATTSGVAPYNGVCGGDYKVIDSTPVGKVGVVYVTWSASEDKVCAVTLRNAPGPREFMEVTLDTWPESSHPVQDAGSYSTYAGPVYNPTPRPGQCLDWSGSIDIYYGGANGSCA